MSRVQHKEKKKKGYRPLPTNLEAATGFHQMGTNEPIHWQEKSEQMKALIEILFGAFRVTL